MFKIAAIVGGVLLLAGVALAGTLTSLGSTEQPDDRQACRLQQTRRPARKTAAASTKRAAAPSEPGEDLRGPCDEAEHANDARCAGRRGARSPSRRTPATVATNRGHDAGDDHGGALRPGNGGEPGHGGRGGDD